MPYKNELYFLIFFLTKKLYDISHHSFCFEKLMHIHGQFSSLLSTKTLLVCVAFWAYIWKIFTYFLLLNWLLNAAFLRLLFELNSFLWPKKVSKQFEKGTAFCALHSFFFPILILQIWAVFEYKMPCKPLPFKHIN